MPAELELLFLADESLGTSTVLLMRKLGYDIVRAQEIGLSGKPDIEILTWAINHKRVILTEDADFCSILLYPPHLHLGIVVLRIRRKSKLEVHSMLKKLLEEIKPKEFLKTLIVVDARGYRLRR